MRNSFLSYAMNRPTQTYNVNFKFLLCLGGREAASAFPPPKHKEFIVNIWFGLEEAKPLLHHPNPNVNLNFDVTFGWVELRSHPKVNQNLMLTLVV